MSSTPLTEQQFDEAWEGYQEELHACPSPVRQELNEGLAARVQAGQGTGTQSELYEFKDWLIHYVSVSEDFLADAVYEVKHGAKGAKARKQALEADITEAKSALKFAQMFEEQGA